MSSHILPNELVKGSTSKICLKNISVSELYMY